MPTELMVGRSGWARRESRPGALMMFVPVCWRCSAAQTSPGGGWRRGVPAQLYSKQRSGAAQRLEREKGTGTEHSTDSADGGAEPALDKIPTGRRSESTSVSTAKPVAVYRCFGGRVPAGLGAPQAVKRQRKRQQQRQTGGQRHVVGRPGGGAARRAEEAEQLHGRSGRAFLQLTDQITAVDKERDGAVEIKTGKDTTRSAPSANSAALIQASSRAGWSLRGAKDKTKSAAAPSAHRRADGFLAPCRHAQRHRQPIPKRGLSLV